MHAANALPTGTTPHARRYGEEDGNAHQTHNTRIRQHHHHRHHQQRHHAACRTETRARAARQKPIIFEIGFANTREFRMRFSWSLRTGVVCPGHMHERACDLPHDMYMADSKETKNCTLQSWEKMHNTFPCWEQPHLRPGSGALALRTGDHGQDAMCTGFGRGKLLVRQRRCFFRSDWGSDRNQLGGIRHVQQCIILKRAACWRIQLKPKNVR